MDNAAPMKSTMGSSTPMSPTLLPRNFLTLFFLRCSYQVLIFMNLDLRRRLVVSVDRTSIRLKSCSKAVSTDCLLCLLAMSSVLTYKYRNLSANVMLLKPKRQGNKSLMPLSQLLAYFNKQDLHKFSKSTKEKDWNFVSSKIAKSHLYTTAWRSTMKHVLRDVKPQKLTCHCLISLDVLHALSFMLLKQQSSTTQRTT